VLLLGCYWEAYHRGPYDLKVRELELALDGSPEGGGLALRILHLSDIQTDAVGPHERRAVAEGMARRPDLIILTGDYLHRRTAPLAPDAVPRMRELLSRLHAPYGVYAVPGDADRGCWLFEGLDTPCLEDEVIGVDLRGGRRLALVGLSLRSSRAPRPELLAPLLERAAGADYRIVFGHSPDFVTALRPGFRVDLALAGHTHGGQVVLPGFGPLLTLSRLPRRYAGGARTPYLDGRIATIRRRMEYAQIP